MRIIKFIGLFLITIFLIFVVFFNTATFADEIYQNSQYVETNDIDNYFTNIQDYFDNYAIYYRDRSAFQQFFSFYNDQMRYNYNYYVTIRSSDNWTERGFSIYVYQFGQTNNQLTNSSTFQVGHLDNYFNGRPTNVSTTLNFEALKVYTYCRIDIANYGQYYYYERTPDAPVYIPLSVYNYHHSILFNYLNASATSGGEQISNAIQQQTNTMVNETQKQTNAITTATKEQTNALLDTNDTGNETMSVNDTTTDTSADLGGLFNSINSAFTDTTSETQKGFDLKLPNGDVHTFTLKANVLTSFLDNNPVLKAFYQAFFYVVFGGYVIFDFKKIINKLKEGNIDNVVGSSSPVDSVVNMSLK